MRRAGVVEYSASLAEALRLCEAVHASGVLGDADIGRPGDGRLRVESVEWLEQQIGGLLPDELLALAAIDHPVAALASGVRGLSGILEASEESVSVDADAFPGSWIAVSTVYSEPFGELLEGLHGAAYFRLCVRSDDVRNNEVLVLEDDRPIEIVTLGAFIDGMIRTELRHHDGWKDVLSLHRSLAATRPKAEMIEDRVARVSAPVRRVVHRKFGVGDVLESDGSGPDAKLTVLFDDGMTRRLLARFLEELR